MKNGKPKILNQSPIRIISLFAGCGGTDLGFEGGFTYLKKHYPKTRFKTVWANDIDPHACETFAKRFGNPGGAVVVTLMRFVLLVTLTCTGSSPRMLVTFVKVSSNSTTRTLSTITAISAIARNVLSTDSSTVEASISPAAKPVGGSM